MSPSAFSNIFLVIFSCLAVLPANAQVITDKTFFDFGEVGKDDKKYVDYNFTNASNSPIQIIRHETPYGVSIKYSNKTIQPDKSVIVRIKYTPKRKGEFKADVSIWVSSNNEAIVLTIKGKAISFDVNESMDVPEIEMNSKRTGITVKELNFKVIRKDDKRSVEGAKIDIIWDGVMYKTLYTNLSGKAKSEFAPDNYYLVANANDLGSYETGLDFNNNVQEVIIELGPKGTITSVDEDSVLVLNEEPVVEETQVVHEDTALVIALEESLKEEKNYENPNFSDDEFVANNIVFLIDVSISMKQSGRMDLLKASMIELTNLLRSSDKVAIVTYSSKADLALKSTTASNKAEIISVIKSLEPKGSTSGERGIKKAYQVLDANKIEGGNNQVFISTDGAFNLDRQDKTLIEMVTKNTSKGYKISVIGIRNSLGTVKNMKKIAQEGHGNYLHINNFSNARSILVEEIKFQSRKNH